MNTCTMPMKISTIVVNSTPSLDEAVGLWLLDLSGVEGGVRD